MDSQRLRTVLIVLGIGVATAWLLQFLWELLGQVGALVVTLLLAWIINLTALGPVRFLRRLKVPRWVAAAVVYLVFAGLTALAAFYVLPPLFAQIGAAADNLTHRATEIPDALADLEEHLTQLGVPADFTQRLVTGFSSEVANFAGAIATNVLNTTGAVLGGLALAILTLIISFYILLGWDQNLQRFRALLPPAWEARFERGIRAAERTFGAWVGGQLFASTLWGAVVVVTYFVADLPFGLLVGVVTGILMLIPFVGMGVGIILPVIMALTVRIDLAVWVGITLGATSLAIENVIKPRVMGTALGVHPVVVIVSVIVGGVAAGFWGIVFGIPIGALIWTFARWAVVEYLASQQRTSGQRPATESLTTTSDGARPGDPPIHAVGEKPSEKAR